MCCHVPCAVTNSRMLISRACHHTRRAHRPPIHTLHTSPSPCALATPAQSPPAPQHTSRTRQQHTYRSAAPFTHDSTTHRIPSATDRSWSTNMVTRPDRPHVPHRTVLPSLAGPPEGSTHSPHTYPMCRQRCRPPPRAQMSPSARRVHAPTQYSAKQHPASLRSASRLAPRGRADTQPLTRTTHTPGAPTPPPPTPRTRQNDAS